MRTPVRWGARAVVSLTAILAALACARGPRIGEVVEPAPPEPAVVVDGTLAHHRLSNELFHIDGLWTRVAPDTAFHRWLLQGDGRRAAIALTTQPERFADAPGTKILTGRLVHQTAPSAEPLLHILFLKDDISGTLGAVTFETEDPVIVRTFDDWAGAEVSVVIEISPG